MQEDPASQPSSGDALLDLYDQAVGPVYAYLAARCGLASTAEELDAIRARQTLDGLVATHRAVLILRYLDDLPVPEIAGLLGRSVHATESLLVRARDAFRGAYEVGRSDDD